MNAAESKHVDDSTATTTVTGVNVVPFNNLSNYFTLQETTGQLTNTTQLNDGLDPLTFCLSYNQDKSLGVTPEQWGYLIRNCNLNVNYASNKHALILYFRNKKDQAIELSSEQIGELINNSRLRVPYKGAWSAAEHYLHNRAKQELSISVNQLETLVSNTNLAYVDKDGFNILKCLIASYDEKDTLVTKATWLHVIQNSDLLTAGNKGFTPLMDVCGMSCAFDWDEAHWDHLLKKSDVNHLNTVGRNALMLALTNAEKIRMSDTLWEYFFSKTNLRLRDNDNIDAFGYINPENPRYNFFKTLFDKYTSDRQCFYDVRKVHSVQDTLEKLHGLNDVKKHVQYLLNLSRLHPTKNLNPSGHMRILFVGNQGTGKGLVAKHFVDLYKALNLTNNSNIASLGNSFFYHKNSDFLAGYQDLCGRTIYHQFAPPKDEKDFEPALLGMLNTIGDSALYILSIEPKDLEDFKFKCPKVYSLFTKTINFPDYTAEDLVELTSRMAASYSLAMPDEVKAALQNLYSERVKVRNTPMINGYLAHETYIKMVETYASRLAEADVEAVSNEQARALQSFTLADVPARAAMEQVQSIDELIQEFDALVGLSGVKTNLRKLIALTQANKKRGSSLTTSMHLVFTGNPGTGKTTIARMIGKIYKTLGLLPSGHVVETDRSGLVAGFIGQTAIKTKEVVTKAMGGVLFIDEAYALASSGDTGRLDFGKEAIETLIKLMEDHRKDFAVIVAGYPQEMSDFIKINPGLKSRFPKTLVFEDYTMDELQEIFKGMCKKEGFSYDDEVLTALAERLTLESQDAIKPTLGFLNLAGNTLGHSDFFGNARAVRTIFEHAMEAQALRIMEDDTADAWQLIAKDLAVENVNQ